MIFFLFLINLPQTAGNSCVSKDAYYLGLNMAASGSNISCLSRPLQSRFINCQDRFRRFNLSSDFPFSHNPQIPASFFLLFLISSFFLSFSSLFPPHFLFFSILQKPVCTFQQITLVYTDKATGHQIHV